MSSPENIYYLSGFSGSDGALLVAATQAVLFTDSRYLEQAKQECPGFQLVRTGASYTDALATFLEGQKISGLGLDGKQLSYNDYCLFRDKLAAYGIVERGGLVEKLRMVKDGGELSKVKKAVNIADRAFNKVLPLLKPGVPEREIALQLEIAMKQFGAAELAFKSIVASGARSALPHGVASEKQLAGGDLVTLDFGAVYQGYCSDITRTVVLGPPDEKQLELYRIVLAAQLKAIETVSAGRSAKEVDQAARGLIQAAGYGEYFGHGTGHGLGLSIHEDPRLSQSDATILQEGMTVTVEPGIYLPDWGGVRIEDTVVVKANGCEILTQSPKEELISL